jgi:hypothetical protein
VVVQSGAGRGPSLDWKFLDQTREIAITTFLRRQSSRSWFESSRKEAKEWISLACLQYSRFCCIRSEHYISRNALVKGGPLVFALSAGTFRDWKHRLASLAKRCFNLEIRPLTLGSFEAKGATSQTRAVNYSFSSRFFSSGLFSSCLAFGGAAF